MSYLIRLTDEKALDPLIVGFKFASLARAMRNGFSVPAAVAISTQAHLELNKTGVFPVGLRAEIQQAADEIDLEGGISVRSSATMEDLGDKSFAGIYQTFLDVRGEAEAVGKIERCWQSADSKEARVYLSQAGLGTKTPAMAVILQRMVQPIAAGVAFSSNPLDLRAGEVVIEAVAGLADTLVSGTVTPVRVFVGADGAARNEEALGAGSGESEVSLDPGQWRAVAEIARAAERAADNVPQDIEWAIDRDDRIWLLQTRPITTLADAELPDAPSGSWTRALAVDLWADRLTPFLAEVMMANAGRYDFSLLARRVGVSVAQPTISVIDGYLYVNCESLKAGLAAIPLKLRLPDLESFFPPGSDLDSIPPPGFAKLVSIGIRMLVQSLLSPQSNLFFCEGVSRWGIAKIDRKLATIDARVPSSPSEALEITRQARECLALVQERNQWPYTYATVLMFALRWLAVDRFGLEHGEFLELISRRTDNVTQRIERRLRSLADEVRSDPELLAVFKNSDVVTTRDLPKSFRDKVNEFLSLYGYRARHRAIHLPRWVEAPEELLGMIKTLVERGGGRGRDRRIGQSNEALLERLSPVQRVVLRWLYRRAARYLDLREDLRFFLDKVLFSIRRSLLALGRQTDLGDSVFFLTDSELEQVVSGVLLQTEALAVAEDRKSGFDQAPPPPSFVVGGRPVEEMPGGRDLLEGIGTSPGRVSGRARIVENPTRSDLSAGDILVARNTDPGWTPILSTVGGVVVEEGGLLNHCSIVARELGIPAVVGVRRATERIPDGAEITIDGNLGVVQVAQVQPDSDPVL